MKKTLKVSCAKIFKSEVLWISVQNFNMIKKLLRAVKPFPQLEVLFLYHVLFIVSWRRIIFLRLGDASPMFCRGAVHYRLPGRRSVRKEP